MADLGNFNANDHESKSTLIPAGTYVAQITASEWRENAAKTGRYISLTFEVLTPEHKGRKVFCNLNLQHPNPDAVKFAQADLADICRAVGVLTPNSTDQLHNLPMSIKVVQSKRKDTGEVQNEIKGFKARTETAPPVAGGDPYGNL